MPEPEIKLTVRDPVDRHRALEMSLAEYLNDHLDKLQPMSIGNCIRFKLPNVVASLQATMTPGEIGRLLDEGKPGVYVDDDRSVILVLPKTVEVSVTFDGDHVIKASNLLVQATLAPDYGLPPLKSDLDPRIREQITSIAMGGEVRFERYLQQMETTIFEDKTGKFLPFLTKPWRRGEYLRTQMRYYADMFAAKDCTLCGGKGMLSQQQIGMKSADEFCRCLLPLSK